MAIAIPAGHPLASLDGHSFVALAHEDTVRRQADIIFTKAGVEPKVVLETPYSATICSLVQAGLGIGMVNPITAEPFLGRQLQLRPFEPGIYFRTLLLLPPGRRPPRIIGDFFEELLNFSTFEE